MRKFRFIRILTVLCFTAGLVHGLYSQDLPAFVTDSLDQYVARSMKNWQIPGVAVAIIKDGQIVFVKGYGVTEAGGDQKVNGNTLFMIGSNTKAFTAYSLTNLVLEHNLTMTTPVREVVTDLDMKDDWVNDHLDFTDILSHRMGYRTFQGDFMYWDSDLTTKEVVEKFGQITPEYGFRERWGYTNAGYAVADLAIQKLSGTSWNEYLGKNIFKPLQMVRTTTTVEGIESDDNAAKAHTVVNGKLQEIPYSALMSLKAAGSISSSVNEMSHWLIAQMNGGIYGGKQVLSAEVLQKTHYPVSIIGEKPMPFNHSNFNLYALGFRVMDYDGKKVVAHTGGVGGFVTSVTMVPEDKLGIMVFTNTDNNGLFQSLNYEILDAMLGLPYRNYAGLYYQFMQQNQAKEDARITQLQDSAAMNLKAALPLKKYAGTYRHQVYGEAYVTVEKKTLKMTFEHHPRLEAILTPLGANRFLAVFNDPAAFGTHVFPFRVREGQVDSFVLSVNDFLEYGTYRFTKE